MKRTFAIIKAIFVILVVSASLAHADLGSFLLDLNDRAISDINRFNTTLSRQFNIPVPRVELIVKSVKSPADAFMCFQLSTMTGVRLERVVETYKANSSRGWGVIAKELGIKPGSPAFHALKRGDFVYGDVQTGKVKKNKGKGKGKGKGKKK